MKYLFLGLVVLSILIASPNGMAASLTAGAPLELVGTKGKFDFIKFDAPNGRLLACHTQNGTLDIVDAASSKVIKSIPTGAAQGVALDEKNGRYFVSVSKPPKLVIIDSTKLEVTGEVPLSDPADVMAYDSRSNRAYVCDDEKPQLWVIDPEAKKIVTTLILPGAGMEDLGFNVDGTFLFQCLKDSNLLAKIATKDETITDKWPTAPAEKPHGLAMVDSANAVLVAGGNGKLSLISLDTGKVLTSADIAQRVDEIAYDPGLQQAYCASGTGVISVVSVSTDKLATIDTIPSAPGTHSIAVDPKTHTVWIAYAKGEKAYVQPLTTR